MATIDCDRVQPLEGLDEFHAVRSKHLNISDDDVDRMPQVEFAHRDAARTSDSFSGIGPLGGGPKRLTERRDLQVPFLLRILRGTGDVARV